VIARAQTQLAVFAAQPVRLDGAADDEDKPICLERLFNEVVSALLDGGDSRFDIAVAAYHDHRQIRMALANDIEKLKPVKLAALKPDIENDKAGTARLDGSECLVAVSGAARIIAFIVENTRDQFANIRFIIHNQNIRRH